MSKYSKHHRGRDRAPFASCSLLFRAPSASETPPIIALDAKPLSPLRSNEPMVMSGQATIAVEFLAQCDGLDALVVPLGGGGMLSGICVAAKSINPKIRIFGAEPKAGGFVKPLPLRACLSLSVSEHEG